MRRSETPLQRHARDPADRSLLGFRVLDCRSGKPGSADLGRAALFKRFCHCPVLKFD
jgi:hypothetical protein